MLATCLPLAARVKTVDHLEKDRAQLTCLWKTLNLSQANIVSKLKRTGDIPHNKRAVNHMSGLQLAFSRYESAAFNQF